MLPITPFPIGVAEDSHFPTKHLVHLLLSEGWTISEIAKRLGLSKSTVSFHKSTLGFRMDKRYARRYDWQEIREHYDAGHSMRECQALFGFSKGAWADAVRRGDIVPRPAAAPIDEIFAAGVKRNRFHLKNTLLRLGIKQYLCECCRLTKWRGRPIPLQLHHINGDPLDHRIENLALLCGNCHSQTPNWGGRNVRRRP